MPTEQNFEDLPLIEKKSTIPKKKLIIFVSSFGILLILLLIVAIFTGFNQKDSDQSILKEEATEIKTEFKEEIISPSPYATDPTLLEIEEEIKNIEKKIQETDLKEISLDPPLLEMGISFEK